MRTHTIRQKSSPTPILTLTPRFFDQALACHPEAFTLAVHWFTTAYQCHTGKRIRLDHAQQQAFLERVGANEQGVWHSRFAELSNPVATMMHIFTSGFTQVAGLDFEMALKSAQAFYDAVARVHLPSNPSPSLPQLPSHEALFPKSQTAILNL